MANSNNADKNCRIAKLHFVGNNNSNSVVRNFCIITIIVHIVNLWEYGL